MQTFAADSTKVKNPVFQGVFVDVDVVEPLVSAFSDKHKGVNASLSVNLKNTLFPSFLVGYASYDASSDFAYPSFQPADYTYKVNGPYFKAGVDFNIIKSKKQFKPEGFLGIRYAFSPFSFEIDNVYTSQFVGNFQNQEIQNEINVSGNSFAHWGEFVGGVRVPIVSRLYLGFEGSYKWSFKPKTFTQHQSNGVDNVIHHSYAPGFGDVNGVTWGFRYLISVFL